MGKVGGLLAACIAIAGLAGCGQKGPLYLPDTTGTVITREGTTPPPPAEDSIPKDEENKEGNTPK